jgi:hypothetical protein
MGQFLPRHFTERPAALPHKAATPTVRYRGSYRRQVDAPSKNVELFAVVQRLGGLVVYAVMALARNTQSKTVVKMERGKSAFAGERSSQRNCLSNSS